MKHPKNLEQVLELKNWSVNRTPASSRACVAFFRNSSIDILAEYASEFRRITRRFSVKRTGLTMIVTDLQKQPQLETQIMDQLRNLKDGITGADLNLSNFVIRLRPTDDTSSLGAQVESILLNPAPQGVIHIMIPPNWLATKGPQGGAVRGASLNKSREYLAQLKFAIIFWIQPSEVANFVDQAADLWSWTDKSLFVRDP